MAGVQLRSRLRVWQDVIFALFIRELKSKFNDKFGFAWAFIEPALFIVMLSFIRGRLSGSDVHGIPVFVFMMFGLLLLQSFTGTWGSAATCIKKNKPLYAFRQVHPVSSLVATIFIDFLIKLGVICVLLLFIYLVRIDIQLADPLNLIVYIVLIWLAAASVGLLFAVGEAFVPELEKVRQVLNRPLLFISGVFFSLQDIPQEYWVYFTWNPLLHAIELSRFAAYPEYGDAGVDASFLTIVTIVLLFFALSCYHLTWKRVLSR